MATTATTAGLEGTAQGHQAGGQGPETGATVNSAPVTTTATPTPTPPTPPDPKATRSYGVGSVPIRHNGAFYGVGYEVQLTNAQADRLGNLVTLIPETPEE